MIKNYKFLPQDLRDMTVSNFFDFIAEEGFGMNPEQCEFNHNQIIVSTAVMNILAANYARKGFSQADTAIILRTIGPRIGKEMSGFSAAVFPRFCTKK